MRWHYSSRTSRPEKRELPSRGPGFWWTLTAIVLAIAVGYCAWLARDLYRSPKVLAPGAGYTDPLGVTYTVLAREQVDELPGGWDDTMHPASGAVFLSFTVAVDNFVYVEGDGSSTLCSFDLMATSGEVWTSVDSYDPTRSSICKLEPDEITASQQVVSSFEVPVNMLDQVVGLVSDTVPHEQFPVISEPAR
ncbi:hypothetical protein [Propionimicrobium sp. PCR01-08-3]|uniref:hypothetical protein n=1 Tax=Propionimicrobium sp. PCR01-08-3 TaxID=3052086 RepID=UPI00255C5229|nr:hypothetical protein [Propionimicrobium sp. PCR01-08-3]WIY82590.1 hypothetical protein QQ658_13980 [Propionimicrobium sp. PCR01-08-3]